jgi:hypothetical protein
VITGDNSSAHAAANASAAALLEALGVTMSLTSEALDTGCNTASVLHGTHPLSQGVSGLEYGYTTGIKAGAAAALFAGVSGQVLLAVEGSVVLSADINLWLDSCDLQASQNPQLFANLWGLACEDLDGDGDAGEICGGLDCAPGDPEIGWGLEEVAEDGVDQDCDGEDLVVSEGDTGGDTGAAETGGEEKGCGGRGWLLGLGLLGWYPRRRRTPNSARSGR